jgi:hypothetical protein
MLSQFHVEASFESSSENHNPLIIIYHFTQLHPLPRDYLPLFDIRILVYFSDIDKKKLLIGSTNNRVPDAPRVGTGAVWTLGGGACAVLVPLDQQMYVCKKPFYNPKTPRPQRLNCSG